MAFTDPRIALPTLDHSVFYAYSITVNSVSGSATEIGSFEKFGQRSTRTIDRIRQVMYSTGAQVIDMVWGGTDITLELSRVELYAESLMAAFGFATPSLEHWNSFVDVHEVTSRPADRKTRTLTFKNCVPSDFSKDVDTGTARVMETMTLQASYVVYTDWQ
jgi:hypothetical protein